MSAAPPPVPGQQDADHSTGWIEPASEQGALPRLLSALVSRAWVVVLTTSLALGAAVGYLATAEKRYEAETDVLVTPVPNDTAVPGFGLILDSADPARATETIARLVMTSAVAERAAERLKLQSSAQALLRSVDAKPVAQSNLVAITANAAAPQTAAQLSDAFGQALIDHRTERLHRVLDAAIRLTDARLARLGTADAAQREILLARSTDLRTLRDAPDPSLQVASDADIPAGPVSPRPVLTLAGALLAGAILGVLGVLALESVDPRLRREEQLSASYRLPILARIPRERAGGSGPLSPETISPQAADGYRMLRATLPSRPRPEVERRPPARQSIGLLDSGKRASNGAGSWGGRSPTVGKRYVMITSAQSGDGKTTTALNLAAALAAAGERVILIDADTEQPSIANVLGLRKADGLARVLSEHMPLVDALVPVRLGAGTVDVLPAEPSGDEGLSESVGAALLEQASAFADWVVVDLPPLNAAPDALPLAKAATDLLLTARLRHTNLRELGQLAELLNRQGVVPTGFVVTGTSRGAGARYGAVATSPSPQPFSSTATTDGSTAGRTFPRPVVPG
jgi:non-specific protein-tyrosine kinase